MKKTLLYGATALGLLFTACQSDDIVQPTENNDGPVASDQKLYVSLSISGDNIMGSRAASNDGSPEAGTDFEDGTEAGENLINNVYFVFYDKNGKVVGNIVPVDYSTFMKNETVGPDGETVEKTYSNVVEVVVRKGEFKPNRVICYLNPISPSTLQSPLDVVQTVARASTYTEVGGKKYFAMSNSVFYPYDSSEGATPFTVLADATPQIAVKIPEDNLFTTEAAAEAALGTEKTVNIYVERYAAKLKFTGVAPSKYVSATVPYENGIAGTPVRVELTFNPEYWAVNAEATSTYVIKSFRESSDEGNLLGSNYKYGRLNTIINLKEPDNTSTEAFIRAELLSAGGWNWNNPSYFRSYWAMSPAYFTEKYPEVSSDITNANGIYGNQKYISYNELKDRNNGIGYLATENGPYYFKETTIGAAALAADNPAAAVASVIYVGKYTLSVNGTSVPENTSFYSYIAGPVLLDPNKPATDEGNEVNHPYVYFESNGDATATSAIEGGTSMLKRFIAQSTILYKQVEAADGSVSYTRMTIANDLENLVKVLEVSEITPDIVKAYNESMITEGNADTKFQANTRTLKFKKDADPEIMKTIYIVDQNGYKQIASGEVLPTKEDGTADSEHYVTRTQANLNLMRQVGNAYYYTSGHGYFNIPVKHFGWYRSANSQKDSETINWNIVRVGDFGMVRNHSYTIMVDKIVGLAEGIGNDATPIVPPSHSEKYYMAYAVKILKWAVVPTQTAVL